MLSTRSVRIRVIRGSERAARLIGTTPEFDDLAKEVGLKSHAESVPDTAKNAMRNACRDVERGAPR